MTIESYFEDIADAIRERGGTAAALTPAAMPQAILDIPGGGGSSLYNHIEAIKTDVNGGYMSGGGPTWYYAPSEIAARADVYEVTEGHVYLLHLGSTVGNRFRPALFQVDPTIQNTDVNGASVGGLSDSPSQYQIGYSASTTAWFVVPQGYHYLVVGKTNINTLGIKTYLVEFNESI